MYNLVNEEISFMEKIKLNHFNYYCFRNKYHNDNDLNSNRIIKNELGNKKL